MRPLVQGEDVLFLGRDNFISWELLGAEALLADPEPLRHRGDLDPLPRDPDQRQVRLGQRPGRGPRRRRDRRRCEDFDWVLDHQRRRSTASAPPEFEPGAETEELHPLGAGPRRDARPGEPGPADPARAALPRRHRRLRRPAKRGRWQLQAGRRPCLPVGAGDRQGLGARAPTSPTRAGAPRSWPLTARPLGDLDPVREHPGPARHARPGFDAGPRRQPALPRPVALLPCRRRSRFPARGGARVRFTGHGRTAAAGRPPAGHPRAAPTSARSPRPPFPRPAREKVALSDVCGRYVDWYALDPDTPDSAIAGVEAPEPRPPQSDE